MNNNSPLILVLQTLFPLFALGVILIPFGYIVNGPKGAQAVVNAEMGVLKACGRAILYMFRTILGWVLYAIGHLVHRGGHHVLPPGQRPKPKRGQRNGGGRRRRRRRDDDDEDDRH